MPSETPLSSLEAHPTSSRKRRVPENRKLPLNVTEVTKHWTSVFIAYLPSGLLTGVDTQYSSSLHKKIVGDCGARHHAHYRFGPRAIPNCSHHCSKKKHQRGIWATLYKKIQPSSPEEEEFDMKVLVQYISKVLGRTSNNKTRMRVWTMKLPTHKPHTNLRGSERARITVSTSVWNAKRNKIPQLYSVFRAQIGMLYWVTTGYFVTK